MRKVLLLALVLHVFLASNLLAQTYPMSNTTVTNCAGTFYDSGGNLGNYGNNQNFTMTFCASGAGNCVRLAFTSFDIEANFDEMTIYDGANTSAPVIGVYTGTNSPGLITSNNGCLTITFTSDGIFNYTGWSAVLSCVSCATGSCAVTCSGGPAPANDACSGAQNLGAIPAPAPCPGGIGGISTTNTTNLCATAETPYTSLLGCQSGGSMSSPAADVWYRFTITGPSLNVNISGGVTTPNVGLYEGTSCANLIPRACAVGSNGTLNTTFTGLAAGTYYMQVSGGSVNDQCDFTLTLQNNFDCTGCVIQSNFTATPPPVNGTYPAGQSVTFCYTINEYNQTSANWLHGIVPNFGPGWDLSSFVAGSATNCSGDGTWNWYNSNVTSSATSNVTGPGFYYESPLGNVNGVVDGNPGNNFGDNNGTNTCDWTFCWTISTLPPGSCVQGASLNITVDTYGDGESGSWTSLACTQDPITNFFATLNCCEAPVVNTTNPLCPGQNTGSCTVQGQGTGPWDYEWLNGSGAVIFTQNAQGGSSSMSNLAPGSYTVNVTDNTGCTASAAFTITAPATFTASMATTNLTCNGSSNGTATVTVNGGTAGYTYAWSPSGSGASPVALPAGNYTVTVTDANGCTASATGTITQPAVINASVSSSTNVSCNAGQDGAITVSATGGTPAYSYSWSNGSAGTTISGLSAGTYTVTVTDSRGCTGFMSVVISQPTAINLNLSSTSSSCGNANGTATVVAAGGTPGYTYAWSPSGGSSSVANSLSAGGYNVTVTDSRGCTAIGNIIVSNSSGPTASISASTNVTCNGGANGSATVNVSGGTAPLSYNWTPSGGSGTTASGLSAGNYTVTVSDGSGCTSAASVIISEPTLLTATITANTPASCSNENDGSLTVQANGGTPGYTYNWSGGSVNPSDNNLTPGTYTVTITDAAGCTASVSATVNAPALLQVAISTSVPVSCSGGADGSATASASGGTAGYSYVWSNGNATAVASGLSAGTYTVTVTDAHGCTAITTVNISAPNPMVLNLSSTGTTCGNSNGSVSVVVNGGTPVYSYAWNPVGGNASTANGLGSGNYTVIVTDANGCTASGNVSVASANGPVLTLNSSTNVSCPGGTDGSLDINVAGGAPPYSYNWSNGASGTVQNNLSAGTYILTVTDANNCSSALPVNITQPSPFVFNVNSTTAHCGQADGSITITVNGGTPAYTYAWSNGSTGSTTLTGVVPGTYTMTVTDNNGCTAADQGVIADLLPPVVTLNNVLDVSCFGGADGRIRINIAGGTNPYTYVWSNGAATGLLNSNLAAGTYTVTATDNFGCTATLSATVNEPPQLQLVTGSTAATCGASNGSASVVVNGGTPGYTYAWVPAGGVTANPVNLAAGAYTVTATDNNGCTEQANVTVPSSNGPTVAVLISTDVTCNGGNNGDLTIAVNGGAAPYNYQWSSGGSGTSGTNLSAGNYTVTVTDANNCTSTVVAVINEPAALLLTGTPYTAHCGQSDGSADVTVNGGVPAYNYAWSTGTSSNNSISAMPAGGYTVTVTDANGCTAQSTVNIPDQPGPVMNIASLTDASCNGGTDGTISIATAGGNAPYSYSWSNGANAAVNTGLSAGTYTVTVTDNFGCTSTLQGSINEPPAIQLSFNATTSTCGNANGTATVTPAGGTTPYSYNWSSGANTATASGLAAGIYSVTVTDAGGCTITGSAIVNSAGGPVLAPGPVVDVSCFGGSDGSANVIVVSGSGPYIFDWLPYGGNAATATGLTAGNYKVSVTDVNGCSTALNFDVYEPTALVVNNLTTPVSCNGGADGTATIDAQGGTSPYTYDWNPGGPGPAARILLSAGNYTVTVTDARGCTAVTQAVISEPSVVTGLLTATDASCNGGSDGSAGIVAGGGIAPYTFLWNDGSSGTQLTGLSAGSYSVTITDNNGCPHSETVNVGEPAAINLIINITDATCGNSNGSLLVNGNGGTGTLNYQWSIGSNTALASGLAPGNYTVVATDANGCTQSAAAGVSNLGGPVLNLLSSADALCNGSADGSAEVTITTGNGPYTYQWNPSGGTAAIANGLTAGAYSVDVTDANGCTSLLNVNIAEPTLLSAQLSSTQATCGNANGSATALANGGTGGYQYLWSNGDINATANSLNIGNYTVTITDGNGCSVTNNISVTEPAPLAVQSTFTDATCFNGNDGTANVIVNGGTAPFIYAWSNGNATALATSLSAGAYTATVTDANGCTYEENIAIGEATAIVLAINTTDATCGSANGQATVAGNGGTGALTWSWSTGQSTSTISGLTAGAYTVIATDANGCTTSSIAAVANLGGPAASVLSTTDVSCNGGTDGSGEVVVSSGNGPYTYQWLPSGGANPIASGLAAGAYAVNITDANGCISSINININEPAALALQLSSSQASCGNANGSATVISNGGTSPYTYSWSNGDITATANSLTAGNYNVVVTDANGCTSSGVIAVTQPSSLNVQSSGVDATCFNGSDGSAAVVVNGGSAPYLYNWSNGANSSQIAALSAGAYTATVTDANGCAFSTTVNVGQAAAINLQLSITDATCGAANGSASIAANGGTGVLSYLWSQGQSSTSITNLSAGTYTVTVTDGSGCTALTSANVANLGGPQASVLNSSDVSCYAGTNGTAEVNVSAGNGPYTYQWQPLGGTNAIANNLSAGNYTAIITDANGCISNLNVTINEPLPVNLQLSATQATCGNANGSATVMANGGTGVYTYAWSNGDVNAVATTLAAGNYSIIVTDANGCTETGSIAVTQPSSLAVVSSSTDATCYNGTNGAAVVNVNGGSSPYTYLWNTGDVTSSLSNLSAGNYTVTVTDFTGCSYADVVTVNQPSAIQLIVATTDATCGGSNGSATIAGNGGTGALNYIWSSGQSTTAINNMSAGAYTVVVTDANGCSATSVANIANIGGPQVAVLSSADVSCNGGSNGSAEVIVNAGAGPFTYQWQPSGGSTTQASGLSAGNYTVVVTDVNGCLSNINIVINEPSALQVQLSTQQATCGNANGTASATPTGGFGAYQYTWSNGASGVNAISALASGTYTVTVTDGNNCSTSNTVAVANAGGPLLAVNNVTPAACAGTATGSASITVNGGNAPFTYGWSPSGGSNAQANGLIAGNYVVAVTDANGCVSQQAIVIQEPAPLILATTVTPTQCNASNGTAQVQVSGGVAGYTYVWSNGAVTSQATGMNAGNYSITVSDANGCTSSASVTITGLPGPSISAVTTNDVACFGGSTGSAQVQYSSGSAPYSYNWSNGTTSSSATGLNAGNYTVTVTDNFGCSDARAFSIQQPAALVLSAAPVNMVSCYNGNDGNAEAIVTGGTSPYTYLWSNGTGASVASGLSASTYTVTITDLNGCTQLQSTVITEPTQLTLSQQLVTNVSCYSGTNGSASYLAGGGTAPYQYNWSNGNTTSSVTGVTAGTYSLTLTDANGCNTNTAVTISQPTAIVFNPATIVNVSCNNGNNGQLSVSNTGGVAPYTYQWSTGGLNSSVSNLTSGVYSVTVTDANGCTENESLTVTEPTAISLQSTTTPIPCFGQANAVINVMATGGVAPYSYNWSNGAVTGTISSLSPGTYTITITDSHLCIKDTTFIISQPPLLVATVAPVDTICIGQSATLNTQVTGGTPVYNYQWSNNTSGSSVSVNPANSTVYAVSITDANGCSVVVSNINVPVFSALSVILTVSDDTLCEGQSTLLSAMAGGGNGGPYVYTWNANTSNVTGFTGTPDSTFTYSVTISDGCTVYQPQSQQLVVVHPLPEVKFSPLDTAGCNPVAAQFQFNGQTTSGSVYSWQFGDNTTGAGANPSHIYMEDGSFDVSLTVTDMYGCIDSLTQTNVVTVYPLPVAFYTTQPQQVSILHPLVQFLNESSGAVSAHWEFGDGTLSSFEWSPEHTFGDTGRYWVELISISNEGCVDTFLNEIIVRGEVTFYVPNAFTPNNDGDNELFTGYGIGIQRADFFIFDRWGKMIYQSNSLEKGWNGTYYNNGDPCPEGTYVYLFKIYTGEPVPKEYTGRVSLVR